MNKDKEDLIIQNVSLVHFIVLKMGYNQSYYLYDDLVSEGMLALVDVANRFDESRNVKFSTYAVPYISGKIKTYIRAKEQPGGFHVGRTKENENQLIVAQQPLSFEFDLIDADGDESKFSTIIGVEDEGYLEAEVSELEDYIIKVVRTKMSQKSADIFEEYLWSELLGGEKIPQEYLAQKYRLTQPQISRIIIRCKKLIKQALELRPGSW